MTRQTDTEFDEIQLPYDEIPNALPRWLQRTTKNENEFWAKCPFDCVEQCELSKGNGFFFLFALSNRRIVFLVSILCRSFFLRIFFMGRQCMCDALVCAWLFDFVCTLLCRPDRDNGHYRRMHCKNDRLFLHRFLSLRKTKEKHLFIVFTL